MLAVQVILHDPLALQSVLRKIYGGSRFAITIKQINAEDGHSGQQDFYAPYQAE